MKDNISTLELSLKINQHPVIVSVTGITGVFSCYLVEEDRIKPFLPNEKVHNRKGTINGWKTW